MIEMSVLFVCYLLSILLYCEIPTFAMVANSDLSDINKNDTETLDVVKENHAELFGRPLLANFNTTDIIKSSQTSTSDTQIIEIVNEKNDEIFERYLLPVIDTKESRPTTNNWSTFTNDNQNLNVFEKNHAEIFGKPLLPYTGAVDSRPTNNGLTTTNNTQKINAVEEEDDKMSKDDDKHKNLDIFQENHAEIFGRALPSYIDTVDSTNNRFTFTNNTQKINAVEEKHDKIFGGTQTNVTSFPYIVSVQLLDEHYCAGSLIKVDWVLTAAHCLVDVYDPGMPSIPVEDYDVIAGQTNVMDTDDYVKHDVFATYPNQMYVDRLNVTHDIGLINLQSPFKLTTHIQLTKRPPPLAFERLKPTLCTVVGWSSIATRQHITIGKLYHGKEDSLSEIVKPKVDDLTTGENDPDKESHPATVGRVDQPMGDLLNYIETDIVGYEKCQEMVTKTRPYIHLLNGTVICSNPLSSEEEACQGDSGGPVVCNGFQMGVTSWGFGCNRGGLAGVYTRVDHYLDWIDAVMSNAPGVRGATIRANLRSKKVRTKKWRSSSAIRWNRSNFVDFFIVYASSFLLMLLME